jgi:hypothetical protein
MELEKAALIFPDSSDHPEAEKQCLPKEFRVFSRL